MPGNPRRKVIVVGGGVGGLSAAHELVNRGFEVHVYERHRRLGGKARSTNESFRSSDLSGNPVEVRLPTEHGFRFFPGFYQHVIDTMKNIPTREGSVADHLVTLDQLRFLGNSTTNPAAGILPLKPVWQPAAFFHWVGFLPALLRLQPGVDGLPLGAQDIAHFAARFWLFLTTCHERREAEFEGLPWYQFIQADERSDAYRKYLGIGLTRNLVACKADQASTFTVGTIGLQLILDVLYSILLPRRVDRVLDGPTNDVWIDPWVAHLEAKGVEFHQGIELTKIDVDVDGRRVQRLHFAPTIRDREEQRRRSARVCQEPSETKQAAELEREGELVEEAAHYIFAMPIEQMSTFVTAELRKAAPTWGLLPTLAKSVDWMNGVMFYLTRRSKLATGHIDYLDSDWALTSVFQDETIWARWSHYVGEDPEIKQILSVDVSDWTSPRTTGLHQGRAASQLPRAEVDDAVWEQVKETLERRYGYEIADRYKKFDYVDEDITDARKQVTFARSMAAKRVQGAPRPVQADPPQLVNNAEPLLVNRVRTRRLRPNASGDLVNAYLASDYVRTTTDLATMEGANEAARRAVNEILEQEGLPDPCQLFPLREPFGFLRALDRRFFVRGRPRPKVLEASGAIVAAATTVLVKVVQVMDDVLREGAKVLGRPPIHGTVMPATDPRVAE